MKVLGDQITIMGRQILAKCRFWFVVSSSFLLWYLILCFYNSEFTPSKTPISSLGNDFGNSANTQQPNFVLLRGNSNKRINQLLPEETGDINNNNTIKRESPRNILHFEDQILVSDQKLKPNIEDSCSGRYVYIHDLPTKFNDDLLKNCRSLSDWTDMCEFTSNSGFGPPLSNAERAYSNKGWYATNQFSLEVVFHNRMKRYECLTNDSSSASAVFVPYYAGLDIARYLWGGHNTSVRDSDSVELVKWLREKPEWKRMFGRDHFAVAGRITWDFRRLSEDQFDWGNKFLLLPESKNMSVLTIESSPWHNNDIGIPYPTYFHPLRDEEVFQWQGRMRREKRRFLFSFAGAARPNIRDSIRNEIIDQCRASKGKCKLLECSSGSSKCHKPDFVMKMFQSSVFCLQPPGDSSTRRSAFDSILAGCIPVFFHPGSAYLQYLWHLPRDFTKYSVFIHAFDVKNRTVSIEKTLVGIPRQKVAAMRGEVIRLIPKVIYASSKLETLDDAFDISIKGVLERVSKIKKKMEEGKDSSFDYPEELSWKYNFFGTVGEHEWDRFFFKNVIRG